MLITSLLVFSPYLSPSIPASLLHYLLLILSVISFLLCSFLLTFVHMIFIFFCLFASQQTFPFSFSFNAADIKKHTSDDNPDKITLEKAIESLKEVMTWVGTTSALLLWWSHSRSIVWSFPAHRVKSFIICISLTIMQVELLIIDHCWVRISFLSWRFLSLDICQSRICIWKLHT